MAGRLRLSGGLQFARLVVSGVSAVADRFESEQAKAFLTGPAMHADLQPEEPGTGIYALLLSMLGQRFGMPVAEGGTGQITAALVAKARHDGVEIATGRDYEFLRSLGFAGSLRMTALAGPVIGPDRDLDGAQ